MDYGTCSPKTQALLKLIGGKLQALECSAKGGRELGAQGKEGGLCYKEREKRGQRTTTKTQHSDSA